MYCSNCGSNLSENARFCINCGYAPAPPVQQPFPMPGQNQPLVGFSSRINHPAFSKYRRDSTRWALVFSIIIAVAAVIGFPIYGSVSGELEMPYSLYYGMGIGAMFIVIAVITSVSKVKDTTWDGIVVDKKIYEKQRYDKYSDMFTTYTVYEYKVKRDNRKVYSHRTENDDTVYNYYNIGDRVRHHKGFGVYEKFDKSKDTFLLCTACASINNISEEVCHRCKCPLLK